jgi:hypothetical protein
MFRDITSANYESSSEAYFVFIPLLYLKHEPNL